MRGRIKKPCISSLLVLVMGFPEGKPFQDHVKKAMDFIRGQIGDEAESADGTNKDFSSKGAAEAFLAKEMTALGRHGFLQQIVANGALEDIFQLLEEGRFPPNATGQDIPPKMNMVGIFADERFGPTVHSIRRLIIT